MARGAAIPSRNMTHPCQKRSCDEPFAVPFFRSIACALLLLGNSHADVSGPTPVPKLAVEAQVVLHARVLSVSTLKDSAGEIYSEVQFEPVSTWKGKVLPEKDRIVHSGGIFGEEMALASGQVAFVPGEEFVAFLVRNSRGELVTVGMDFGKFRIHNGEASRLKEKLSFAELRRLATPDSK